jgi:hypothetical protein
MQSFRKNSQLENNLLQVVFGALKYEAWTLIELVVFVSWYAYNPETYVYIKLCHFVELLLMLMCRGIRVRVCAS